MCLQFFKGRCLPAQFAIGLALLGNDEPFPDISLRDVYADLIRIARSQNWVGQISCMWRDRKNSDRKQCFALAAIDRHIRAVLQLKWHRTEWDASVVAVHTHISRGLQSVNEVKLYHAATVHYRWLNEAAARAAAPLLVSVGARLSSALASAGWHVLTNDDGIPALTVDGSDVGPASFRDS